MVEYSLCFALMVVSNFLAETDQRTPRAAEEEIELSVTSCDVSDGFLKLCYHVVNSSSGEIWICDDIDIESAIDIEILAIHGGTRLLIRSRLGLPMGWWRPPPPAGKYVRLASGERYAAALHLAMPVRRQPVLASRSAHHPERVQQANSVALEVGYILGDFPADMARFVTDVNEARHRLLQDEEAIEERRWELFEKELKLHDELESAANNEEREQLERQLQEVLLQQERWTRAYWNVVVTQRLHYYLPSLDIEIPEKLIIDFEYFEPVMKDEAGEMSIPHGYTQHVKREHFLRCVVEGVQVTHLPPRYLHLDQGAPWQKMRIQGAN